MTKSRTQLVVIMLVALVSLGGAYGLFYLAKSGVSWGTTNNGEFIDPPITVQQLGWQLSEDLADDVSGHWWLWVVAEDCQLRCQQAVKDLRALHLLLNKEADRVRRGFTGDDVSWQALQKGFPALAQISVPDTDGLRSGIYIADPLGNLVFYYAIDVDPKLVQEDVKKLLKLSQIG